MTSDTELPTDLGDGQHTVDIRAFNELGNMALSSVMFTVDTTPPVVTV